VGIYNWTIIEAATRIGGRIHTSYLNNTRPDQYQYQEMGPMRFPVSVTYPQNNETYLIKDHQMVFQLAEAVNNWNSNKSDLVVNFIKWIQNSPNAPVETSERRPDGTIPGSAEVQANPSLADNSTAQFTNATDADDKLNAFNEWAGLSADKIEETYKNFGDNIFEAHKMAVENGLFDWSESQYIRYVLNTSLNETDQIDSTSDLDPTWVYDSVYFSATDWRTIDKGLSSLWRAMEPFSLNRTLLNSRVSALSWDESTNKMTVKYRSTGADPFTHPPDEESRSFDYVVVAVPFSIIRGWRISPPFSSLMSRAISTMNYEQSCKVALHYKTRFWEHLSHPIFGGCGATNIPPLGEVCYPSYQLNSSGPGVLLASYSTGTDARTLGSYSEADHVAWAQRAMVEIHGEIANEQFTGIYDRVCWEFSPFQAGAWCQPVVGQQELYLPAYFETEMNTVFVGEHTSFTHAWIWSALESAVRGTTQLLLEMGLVDEAKEVVDTWTARWISV
jgi:monoamine oxidase